MKLEEISFYKLELNHEQFMIIFSALMIADRIIKTAEANQTDIPPEYQNIMKSNKKLYNDVKNELNKLMATIKDDWKA